jgi:alanine racemase
VKQLVINKSDLIHNINVVKKFANLDAFDDNGNSYKIIGVVKGNGYGLGLVEYAKILIDNGIEILAVATASEGVLLRQAGIEEDILMMSVTCDESDLEQLIENGIIITVRVGRFG